MDTLILHYNVDDSLDGELFADVAIGRFRGSGSAWFSIERLREFCHSASMYPIREGQEPSLAGGFWDEAGQAVQECHLGIRIAPHRVLGLLKVSVTVAEPIYDEVARDCQRLTASFLVNYSDIDRFRGELLALIEGRSEQATLRAIPT